ncbi:N-acetylglucosamine/diacetylchitobiose ABC transporter substrate-binding protein [Aestuariimicrobium soli]|uniref:N-acetylglucosamine/diacetylchitobiose ABC transporter substrate-binding protein n=1 Tax=Aestuariimicrobium soli TaxID=2035834 RepID=UPI003EBCA2BD
MTPILETSPFGRRGLLTGAIAALAVAPLAACATGGGSDETTTDTGGADKTDDNPFGVAEDASLEAVIFNGGYGYDYCTFAADQMKKKFPGLKAEVKPSTQIAQELQPRFVGGTPPDVVDNSGAGAMGLGAILDQLAELDDVFEAKNYEGTPIADTLFPGVKDPGVYDGKFKVINYVMSVYGIWYSASLFEENGWTPPKTWAEALELGAKAKEKGKYLFLWGKEAATYYQTLVVDSAIKEGGDEVRLALENLKEGCWSLPQVQGAIQGLEAIIKAGYMKPGGQGTQFTAAQAQWSQAQEALLYPSGSWIENEMSKQTKDGFKMTGVPELAVSDSPAMGHEAVRAAAGEPFIVPAKGKNVASGKEFMRAMLSKEAATNFAKTRLSPTIVKDTVPADGFGSTALVSQTTMLTNAGDKTFNWRFVSLYGTNKDMLVPWNSFLAGQLDAAGLTKALQGITDKVRNDDSVKKIEVTK